MTRRAGVRAGVDLELAAGYRTYDRLRYGPQQHRVGRRPYL
jgi:hypothetical protein